MKTRNNITRKELVERVYENRANLSLRRSDIDYCVTEFLSQVEESLSGGNSVELRGFGTFSLKKRNAKNNARNPKTGQAYDVMEHYIVQFTSGEQLKKDVKNLKED